MKITVLALALLAASLPAQSLFLVPDGSAMADHSRVVVYRAEDHILAFGQPSRDDRVLSEEARGLEDFAVVTIRNENGAMQAAELGKIVYRHGHTLIVRLHRPLTGTFLRSDIFMVQPLLETRAPAEPIPVPFRGEYDDTVADIVSAVSEDSLISITYNYQSYLTRHSSTDGYDTACEWSNERFLSYGLDSEVMDFPMSSYESHNVVAIQTGTVYPDQYWMICGHLDSTSPNPYYNAPGADDNGSGSAAVVEAARIMSQYDFEYSVIYALWGGEEQGLHGSGHYADSAAAAGSDILGVVNLDMIFYGPPPNDIAWLHYNTASQGLGVAFSAISDTYVPALQKEVTSSPSSASDHASFWNVGYAAMLSIERAVWSNPYYHQTTDLMDNYLEYFPFGTNMAKAAIATVAYLAVPVSTGTEQPESGQISQPFALALLENPVSSVASASVSMPSSGPVRISVYDLSGREMLSRTDEMAQGLNSVSIGVEALPSGVYILQASASGNTASMRMVLTR
jgi:hypothetical protein